MFLSFNRCTRAWRKVSTGFIGEARPRGIDSPFGVKSDEGPSAGLGARDYASNRKFTLRLASQFTASIRFLQRT